MKVRKINKKKKVKASLTALQRAATAFAQKPRDVEKEYGEKLDNDLQVAAVNFVAAHLGEWGSNYVCVACVDEYEGD